MFDTYEIAYAITNIFGTYIIYKLLTIFFGSRCSSRKVEIISYIGYYFISSLLFFLVRIPIIMMVSNVVMFFCLTLNYDSTFKKRLIFSFLTFIILSCVEVMVSIITQNFDMSMFANSEFDSVVGMFLIRIVSILVVTIISVFKNVKGDMPIPTFYWLGTILISVSSFILLIMLFQNGNFGQTSEVVLAFVILAINFMVIIMYENLYKAFASKSEKLLLEEQNKAYEKQLEIMEQSRRATQIIRHDMKNHMISLKNLCLKKDNDNLSEYFDNIISKVSSDNVYSNSGNYVIDSILNFKLQDVNSIGVKPEVTIAIPEEIEFSSYEMTIILGNLMDNAIEALRECKGERILSIKIKYSKKNIIISFVNSFTGQGKVEDGVFITTKSDAKNHGIGLKSVEETVRKNHGHLDFQQDNGYFKVTIVLPI